MVIETANLVKEYADRRVVNNVSIRVEQGSIVGLLGPNGAGKNYYLYMIVGIIKPDSGTVTLDGQDISGLPMYMRARAGIGYLPQEASIFRKMTVEENILAILEANNVPEKERYEKMNALVEEFHIDHIRKNKGTELPAVNDAAWKLPALWQQTRHLFCWMSLCRYRPDCVADIQNMIAHLAQRGIGILITTIMCAKR